MALFEILILAIVQGVGEFLPISSSGHVVVVAALFDQFGGSLGESILTVNIVLHLGTLAAILAVYRRRIWAALTSQRRVACLVVVGSIPAALVGVSVKLLASEILQEPLLAGLMFPLTGALLLWSANRATGLVECGDMSYRHALLIGVSQALAILPGVSRSGATIVTGLACGLRRQEAAAFSFLLAIPAIGGAGLIEVVRLVKDPSEQSQFGLLALGAAVSFFVGLASLGWLLSWLEQGRLHFFAWWVISLGVVVLAWQCFLLAAR